MLSFFLVDNGIIESNRIESNQPYFEVASLIQKIKFIKLLQSNRKIWYDMVRYIMNRNRISLFIKDVNVSQSHCCFLSCDTVSIFCIISSPTFPLQSTQKSHALSLRNIDLLSIALYPLQHHILFLSTLRSIFLRDLPLLINLQRPYLLPTLLPSL